MPTTGSDGKAVVTGLAAGTYTATVVKNGITKTAVVVVDPIAEAKTGTIRLKVFLPTQQAGVVEVFVQDEFGKPVSGATVTVA